MLVIVTVKLAVPAATTVIATVITPERIADVGHCNSTVEGLATNGEFADCGRVVNKETQMVAMVVRNTGGIWIPT